MKNASSQVFDVAWGVGGAKKIFFKKISLVCSNPLFCF